MTSSTGRCDARNVYQIPEVGAGWFNEHVRICAGGAGKPAFLPRPIPWTSATAHSSASASDTAIAVTLKDGAAHPRPVTA